MNEQNGKNKTIITISRQYGSGGRFIGEQLANALGIPFYDHELIKKAAKASGYAEETFENAEQSATSSLLYSLSLMGELPLQDQVYIVQTKIIKEIAEQGSCVIVGRCGDYALRDFENATHIYIYSDLDIRAKRVAEFYSCQAKNVLDFVKKIDKKRSAYYNYYTGQKWGKVSNYELCIDSSKIGIEGAVNVIKEFVKYK
ncbi:MAG: cytidylate kinase-like family protein [Oscillospiraceae bacterium]